MEMSGSRGKSRSQNWNSQTHFQTVRHGGFEEEQMICYLWGLVKSMEAVRTEQDAGQVKSPGVGDMMELAELEKELRRRVRVEMRRYFTRRKRRTVKMTLTAAGLAVSLLLLFGGVLGVDQVSGNSMYPYLNDGDWIVYSRRENEFRRDEVIVFEKNGENLVKRIAGLPGDTVEISSAGGRVVVNGMEVREHFVTLTGSPSDEKDDQLGDPMVVMDGQYLVLGDNREVSIDSRDRGMGTVSRSDIQGRVVLVVRRRQV